MSYNSVWKRHADLLPRRPLGILATLGVDYGTTCWKERTPHPENEIKKQKQTTIRFFFKMPDDWRHFLALCLKNKTMYKIRKNKQK